VREIHVDTVKEKVKALFLAANYHIGGDVTACLKRSLEKESSKTGRSVLEQILKNNQIASDEELAICQDTGTAVVFAKVGQEVHFTGGSFADAVNAGVAAAYQDGYLRKSIVYDPVFDRKNTQDNTPAVLYTDLVPGDRVTLEVTCKGAGSENMSKIRMLVPADGEEGILDCIVDAVREAGPNPCPPVIVGVGVGGTMDKACQLAKHATMRAVGSHNADRRYQALEEEAMRRVNSLGIGPGGFGGSTTALCVNIEEFPTHIATMPTAVNICCHAGRHAEGEI
jgi:fumarate hydratase subunit alpha